MLRIYGAAIGYGIHINDDESIGQIGTNVADCLECDEDEVILLALRVARALQLGLDYIEPDVVERLAFHPDPGIAKLAAELGEFLNAD
jgi:hypothetical protein